MKIKEKIHFFNTVQGVADAFPIIKSSEYKPLWFNKCKEDFKDKQSITSHQKFFHVNRCPGIFDLFNYGFIVSSPFDFSIETNGDGESFRWLIPSQEVKNIFYGDPISSHDGLDLKFMPQKPGSLRSIIKLTTRWNVVVPKNLKFLVLPVPYPDDSFIESVTGILDPSINCEINPQFYCNVLNGSFTIKAGDPLMYMVPLTEKFYEFEVRNANEQDYNWINKKRYFNNVYFNIKRNFLKKMYHKFFS